MPGPGPVGSSEKKAEKSYLASAVESINPWAGSRSSTPSSSKDPQATAAAVSQTVDHATNPFYGLSARRYPPDCPPLKVQWFHAVDVPKRKPKFLLPRDGETKVVQPKKFDAFSPEDSRAIEAAYQRKLQELEDERDQNNSNAVARAGSKRPRALSSVDSDSQENATKVPVKEDFLFDVNIEARELTPVYWEGPVYEVRRGSWFFQEGSNLRPCDENLAAQLEEGYLKVKPWLLPPRTRSASGSKTVTPKPSNGNLKATAETQEEAAKKGTPPPAQPLPSLRLFGNYMNSVVTYQDATTAFLSTDGVLAWVTSAVYEKFAGGSYLGGYKLVRGYSEKKTKEEKRPQTPTDAKSTAQDKKKDEKQASESTAYSDSDAAGTKPETPDAFEATKNRLTRQLSNLIEGKTDPQAEEEAIRQREEKEISRDYKSRADDNQGRVIEHLVLVTHGIGQQLSRRMESVNFIHDVNTMRKTIKEVYAASPDLRALNEELDEPGLGNSRVQVLPVMWRHLVDFPKDKSKKGEHDIGDPYDEEDYPSLDDITVEGVGFARSLISDLALDVLLYQSAYQEQISQIVVNECNRIYRIFKERNPGFNGKVHVVGHSLGSAIMFDILCRLKDEPPVVAVESSRNPLRFWPTYHHHPSPEQQQKEKKEPRFDFEVDHLYCLGSPIGLFEMIKGRKIAARAYVNALSNNNNNNNNNNNGSSSSSSNTNNINSDLTDDPFQEHHYHFHRSLSPNGSPISSPKVSQLYNIFHPSDPIAYRMEPLISRIMTSLKPQTLPYTKKSGFLGSVAQQGLGLGGISAKVGRSVGGLFNSISAGLLNRSLGISGEDVARIEASRQAEQLEKERGYVLSPGAGTNISFSTGGISEAAGGEAGKQQQPIASDTTSGNALVKNGDTTAPVEGEVETLFSRFQKNRVDMAKGQGAGYSHEKWLEEERRAQYLKREEARIRALNRNGRVDYCIQENLLDFNPITMLASHISYWGDQDVLHFLLSQILGDKPNSGCKEGKGKEGRS